MPPAGVGAKLVLTWIVAAVVVPGTYITRSIPESVAMRALSMPCLSNPYWTRSSGRVLNPV